MIVVVGQLLYRAAEDGGSAEGLAARIALAASSAGKSIQVVGKAGEDRDGDAVLLALALGGVGHVAVLRDAGVTTPRAHRTIDGDLDLLADDDGSYAASAESAGTGHDSTADDQPVLDAADVELALRYLTDFSVVVLGDPADEQVVRVVAAATGWAGAMLIVVVPSGAIVPEALPADAIVFEAPDADPDGVFAAMVGAFAAALDDGDDPAAAFRSTVAAEGWTAATDPT